MAGWWLPWVRMSARPIPWVPSLRHVPGPMSLDTGSISASATRKHTGNRGLERCTTYLCYQGGPCC